MIDAGLAVVVAETGGQGCQTDDGGVADLLMLEGDSVVLVDSLTAGNWKSKYHPLELYRSEFQGILTVEMLVNDVGIGEADLDGMHGVLDGVDLRGDLVVTKHDVTVLVERHTKRKLAVAQIVLQGDILPKGRERSSWRSREDRVEFQVEKRLNWTGH